MVYARAVERPVAQPWSVVRSLALLAAIFAVVLGAALPSAVAASSATGHPVQLCSGDQVFVVHHDPASQDTDPSASLTCADCLASVFVSLLPPPPPPGPAIPFARPTDRPAPALETLTAAATVAPRPPSTAPPAA